MLKGKVWFRVFGILLVVFAILVSGCMTAPVPEKQETVMVPLTTIAERFAEIPIPEDFDLDRNESFIFESGGGKVQIARLSFATVSPASDVVNFLRLEMHKRGWEPVRIIEHRDAGMLYEKEEQICSVYVTVRDSQTLIEYHFGPR